MRYIIIIVLIISLGACTTKRKCNRLFPPETKVEVITTTKVVTRDTTIYVTLPKEVISNTDTVYVDLAGFVNSRVSRLETSLAVSTAQIINNRLHHNLIQRDTTIETRLKDALREIETLKETTTKEVRIEEVNVLRWWQKMLMYTGILSLVLVLVYFVSRRFP
jgi:hypothetical protein